MHLLNSASVRVFFLYLAFQQSVIAQTPQLGNINGLFDWVEVGASEYFSPPSRTRSDVEGWLYRLYEQTETYIAVQLATGEVYVLGGDFGNEVVHAGSLSSLMPLVPNYYDDCPEEGERPFSLYTSFAQLMSQVSCSGPIYVTGSSIVKDEALEQAGLQLESMLYARPDISQALRDVGAITSVFAESENVCAIPYFSFLSGENICEEAAGGLGGVQGRPVTACSESNLLGLPSDAFGRGIRTNAENVCVHELAHTIMNVGLSESVRISIEERYQAALLEGLWTGDFALENADEFFAEMSQIHFCANPEVFAFLHNYAVNCAEELELYDPETYSLIHSIYLESVDLR